MAFDVSITNKLKAYKEALLDIQNDLKAASVQAATDAASRITQSLTAMAAPGSDFNKAMMHIAKNTKSIGEKAGKDFAKGFSHATQDFAYNFQLAQQNLGKLDGKIQRLAKRRAGLFGGWGDAEEAQLSADKMVPKIEKQRSKLMEALYDVNTDLDTNSDPRLAKLERMFKNKKMNSKIANMSRAKKALRIIRHKQLAKNLTPGEKKKLNQRERSALSTIKKGTTAHKRRKELDKLINAEKEHKNALESQREAIVENIKALNDVQAGFTDIGKKMKSAEYAGKVQDFHEKMLGPVIKLYGFVQDVVGFIKEMKGITPLIALFGALYKVVEKIIGEGLELAGSFREQGLTVSQFGNQFERVYGLRNDLVHKGIIVSNDEATAAVGAAQNNFGRANVPRELLESIATAAQRFNVSADDAAGMLDDTYRLWGSNSKKATEVVRSISDAAKTNDVMTKKLFSTMASHMEALARSGNMSMEAFKKAADFSNQLDVDLGKFDSFADRLVSDFEGALKSQAELQTMFPGADMSQVMYSAQFGSIQDVEQSVTDMVKGIGQDFLTLPRSFKLALERVTGMSSLDLGKMMGYKPEQLMSKSEYEEYSKKENLFNSVTGNLPRIVELLGNILTSVLPLGKFFSSIANTMFGKVLGLNPSDYNAAAQLAENQKAAALNPKDKILHDYNKKWDAMPTSMIDTLGGYVGFTTPTQKLYDLGLQRSGYSTASPFGTTDGSVLDTFKTLHQKPMGGESDWATNTESKSTKSDTTRVSAAHVDKLIQSNITLAESIARGLKFDVNMDGHKVGTAIAKSHNRV
jgi:soluble cytochrome b562